MHFMATISRALAQACARRIARCKRLNLLTVEDFDDAAREGEWPFLEWARRCTPPCPWHERTCVMAALYGRFDVLQWLRAQDPPCPWDQDTCTNAALGGHLKILQWLRKENCPWDEHTCRGAATKGHLDVLQWVRAQGCPWNSNVCVSAVMSDQLEVLQWMRAQDPPCPWHVEHLCHVAFTFCNWQILQWLYQKGSLTLSVNPCLKYDDRRGFFAVRQRLTSHYHVTWPAPVTRWLAVVDHVSADVLTPLLCPDLVELIHQFC